MDSYQQDPTEAEFVQNPYPFYETTRVSGAAFLWQDYGLPCFTGHAEVNSLLRDRRLGREPVAGTRPPPPAHLAPFYAFERHSLLELEPPAHTRLRGLVVRAFTSRRIKAMGSEIEALSHQLIDDFPDAPFDLLPTFAEKIPVIVIARLLGVPEELSDQLLAWSHDMVAMYQANRDAGIEARAVAATIAFSDFMRSYIEARRKSPRDDLLSVLIAAEEEGSRLCSEELITTAILLLNAGHEATVHAFGNGIKTLLETGNFHTRVLAPDQIGATVEECLRVDPPLHMFTRFIYEDCNLFGHDFRRGDEIGLLLGAANRDPAVYTDAARFNPQRAQIPHTGFGAGVHFCIGAPLARLEMQIALPILQARCPDLRLDAVPRYADRYHFHGLETLIVTA